MILKFLRHKLSSSNYGFGPLQYLFTLTFNWVFSSLHVNLYKRSQPSIQTLPGTNFFAIKVRPEFLNRTKIILGVLTSSSNQNLWRSDIQADRQILLLQRYRTCLQSWNRNRFLFFIYHIFQLQEKIGKGEFGDVRLGVYNGNKVSN